MNVKVISFVMIAVLLLTSIKSTVSAEESIRKTAANLYAKGKYRETVQLLLKEHEKNPLESNSRMTPLLLSWVLSTCPDDNIRDGKAALSYAYGFHFDTIMLAIYCFIRADDSTFWRDFLYITWIVSASSHAELGEYEKAITHLNIGLLFIELHRSADGKKYHQKRMKAIQKLYQNEIPLRTNGIYYFGGLSDDWCDKILNADDVKKIDFDQLLRL